MSMAAVFHGSPPILFETRSLEFLLFCCVLCTSWPVSCPVPTMLTISLQFGVPVPASESFMGLGI